MSMNGRLQDACDPGGKLTDIFRERAMISCVREGYAVA